MKDTPSLRWRHNERDGVSNHQLRVTGLCAGNSPGIGEFPAQMASYAENVSIWWRHHEIWDAFLIAESDRSFNFVVGILCTVSGYIELRYIESLQRCVRLELLKSLEKTDSLSLHTIKYQNM